jgi:hypothetical protein
VLNSRQLRRIPALGHSAARTATQFVFKIRSLRSGRYMSPRNRELRRKRSADKRAEALARRPQMLADEQALRDQVNDLHGRVKRFVQHADYDKEINALVTRYEGIRQSLVSELTGLMNQFGRIMLNGTIECEKARHHLRNLESLRLDAGAVISRAADLCVARAELDTIPADKEDMAQRMEAMAAQFEAIEIGIDRNKAALASVCPELVDC